ncbi:hypothetical protein MAPG_10635 [Magnaporthiopsis poae ATCC 64411]|uniref:Uncharacterized protein n=1 Tax=Magnaporthiopsis poae (strain ATCC 64411 / 73-15) TaxID=644358 RepID=A0A0C4ED42_MAGP6|nr:hypothetical protein MAPG_10635 [Magnaporthiopsis poae ATCC 64411]
MSPLIKTPYPSQHSRLKPVVEVLTPRGVVGCQPLGLNVSISSSLRDGDAGQGTGATPRPTMTRTRLMGRRYAEAASQALCCDLYQATQSSAHLTCVTLLHLTRLALPLTASVARPPGILGLTKQAPAASTLERWASQNDDAPADAQDEDEEGDGAGETIGRHRFQHPSKSWPTSIPAPSRVGHDVGWALRFGPTPRPTPNRIVSQLITSPYGFRPASISQFRIGAPANVMANFKSDRI